MLFQPILLWVRPGANPREEHLRGALLNYAPALLANIIIVWKGLQETNTLAYWASLLVTKKIKFCVYGRGLFSQHYIFLVTYECPR